MAGQTQLLHEFETLLRANNLDMAIPYAERIIVMNCQALTLKPTGPEAETVIQAIHKNVPWLTGWLVREYHRREQWAKALRWQRNLVQFQTLVYGKNDYRVADARQEDAYCEILGKLSAGGASVVVESFRHVERAFELRKRGNTREAIRIAEDALSTQRRFLEDTNVRTAVTMNFLAPLHFEQGNYVRAESLFREAIEIRKKTLGETHPGNATGLNDLGNMYHFLGDYVQAERLLRQSLQISWNVLGEGAPNYAKTAHNLASLYNDIGDHARAEPLLRQASEALRKALGETDPSYATSLNSLASLYRSMGDYARAEPLYSRAIEIQRKALGDSHPELAISLNNMAVLYQSQGDYVRAEPLLQESLAIKKNALGDTHPSYATGLDNLASLFQSRGEWARAEVFRRQAVAIIHKHLESTAAIQSQRQQLAMLQSARNYLDSYLDLATHSGQYVEPVYRALLAWKGFVLRTRRQLQVTEGQPELMPIFHQLQQTTTQYAQLAWATPDPKQEIAWRQQVEKLGAEKERLEGELMTRSADYRQAKRQVTLEELQAALPRDVVLVDFLEYSHYTPAERKQGRTESWERRLIAFVVVPGRPVEMVSLGAVAPVSEAIDTWRKTFGMSLQGAAAGRLLRQRIWEPIEGKLGSAKIVLVSPDGVLGRLPLGALPGKEPGKFLIEERSIALVPVPQLIPEIVNEQGRKQLQKKLLLLGNVDYDAAPDKPEPETPGNPTRGLRAVRGEEIEFPPLPATKTEIAAIGQLYFQGFGPEGVTRLEEKRATKRAFRTEAARHQFLHVATHGFFAPASKRSALSLEPKELNRFAAPQQVAQVGGLHPGLLSGLVLAGANQAGKQRGLEALDVDDGITTAEEIGTLNLEGVELVTLSACETGLGQTAGGEGLLGLQRAFQTASARTVVASLWEVNDDGTRTLMIEFYKNLWEKKLGKLEALRQAQLTMLREYDPKAGKLRGAGALSPVDPAKLAAAEKGEHPKPLSPFYWAAFVLSGDWR
jgi:CHAT domain-containing protein